MPVNTTLPHGTLEPCVRYRRENFCGMRVPGIEHVPGGAGDPALVFMPFLDRYSPASQDKIVTRIFESGYTHLTLSWPDSRSVGISLEAYVQTAERLAKLGLYVDHHFFSKVYDPHNPDPASAYPVIDRLLERGAIQCGTVGWELNAFVDPEYIQFLIDGVTARVNPNHDLAIPCYLHFFPHYASWQCNNETPHDFWMRQVGKIIGLKYQCEPPPHWSAGMMQARINDVLVRLAPGGLWRTPGFDVQAWETSAQAQFNGACDEAEGDLYGYETLCAQGPVLVMGYGNGARYPDGSPL